MCKYCENDNSALNAQLIDFGETEDGNQRITVSVSSDGRLVAIDDYSGTSRPICYCPICGRELREGVKG